MNEAACIALIEDQPDDQVLLELALRRAGIANALETISNMEQALDFLKFCAQTGRQVVVIINLDMLLSAGTEILAWIRRQPFLRQVPVVAIGDSSRPQDAQRAFDLGANAYFPKQVDMDGLARLILELTLLEDVLVSRNS